MRRKRRRTILAVGRASSAGQPHPHNAETSNGDYMADLYLKALEAERKSLWATCRLKGLAKDSPERIRIGELDVLLAEHKASKGAAT